MADDNNLTSEEVDDTNVYDAEQGTEKPEEKVQPAFRVYRESKIAVGKAIGPYWKNNYDAAIRTYGEIHKTWNEVYQYYNNSQNKTIDTPIGTFRRGDGTENMIYSNLNVTLPAIYSKDPNFSCTASDEEDDGFRKCTQALVNQLFRRQDKINAKPRIKRMCGFALLTNFGVLKLEWTKKDDSLEVAQEEMARIMYAMSKTRKQEELDQLYGQLCGLEENMEVLSSSGPAMKNILPQNLIVDPYAEQTDGLDGNWMIERVMMQTNFLNAHYTEPNPEDEEGDKGARVLTYKPTHKAVFDDSEGERDEGLGIVMKSISPDSEVTMHTTDERLAYLGLYYTECFYVWDKRTRRVMLFGADDWTWPIWVWDAKEIINITRFFPYFITVFGFSTGSATSVGEVAYVLDQQDEINDINRRIARIRRTIFDFFYYNSSQINKDEAEKFVKALRGESTGGAHILGVNAGENKITDLFEAAKPPSIEYEALFNKQPIMEAMNRVTNTNDALRGTQFKAYTNQDAVESYQESLRLSIGAKVDVIEDTVSDFGLSLVELCVQHMTEEEVAGIVGTEMAKEWKQMTPEYFRTNFSLEVVAGSMEKPNSVFKKKEAIQVAQALGQFAQAAPGATLMIMLDVMSQAFTDVVVKEEHWQMLRQEVAASMRKGDSMGGGDGGSDPGQGGDIKQMLMSLPPAMQQKVMQMYQQGTPPQEIIKFVQENMAQGGQPPQQQQGGQQAA